jgi:death-on-curing protein
MRSPRFLTVQAVLAIHEELIRRYGGSHGLRDAGLLDSAVHQPQASYGGEYLHPTLFDMAAAYLLHIVSNHPFVDGNKRTGWVACRVFLDMNGHRVRPRWRTSERLVLGVATGRIRDWRTISKWLAKHAKPRQ